MIGFGESQQTAEEKTELEAVLSSEMFVKSPNLAKLLHYICHKHWEGHGSGLKEYNIGVEALGRSPDFDPTSNSIVRVEVHRLREKLRRYYENEGAKHSLVIALQVGHYVPQFVRREEAATQAATKEARPPDEVTPFAGATTAPEADNGVGFTLQRFSPPLIPRALSVSTGLDLSRKSSARWRLFVLAAISLALLTILAAWRLRLARSSVATATASQADRSRAPAATGNPSEVRILAGYFKDNYIDRSGHVWYGDRYFNQGATSTQPRQFIARTLDPTLFQTSRSGEFSYDIPLKAAVYELRLYFMEGTFGPGTIAGGGETSRLFNVLVNGNPVLNTFDPFLDAGGNCIADERVFKDITPAPDGYLHVRFTRAKDDPFVNAIQVVPGTPGRLRPIRIVAQENSYTDPSGRVWSPDRYFSGGRLAIHRGAVKGTADQDLYASERFGKFDYAMPVASGKYAVTLHFAETYFGTEHVPSGGAGDRVFDVYSNGVALLRNFDIFKEAGGANQAVEKTFHGLQPNAQGKLMISFVPVRNYALINAIEVVDESSD